MTDGVRKTICASLALGTLIAGGLAAEPLKYGDPLRKELMNSVRPRVERTLRTKVIFNVHQANRVGEWAFLTAEPKNPDGSAIHYERTPVAKQWKDGVFGGIVCALYRKRGSRWEIRRYDFGASDVTWLEWGKQTGAPKSVFPDVGH
jgi:hypothetical protein